MKFSKKSTDKGGGGAKIFTLVYYLENPFQNNDALGNAANQALERLRLSPSLTTGLTSDSVWALAHCQCTPAFSGQYLKQLVQSRGALPQPLVPAIREQIKNKPLLKALLKLSPGALNGFGGKLVNLFVKDDRIAKEIREGVSEELNDALPGGTKVAEEMNVIFDLYPSPYINLGNPNAFPPKTLSIAAQASKWAYVMSLENMWGTNPALTKPIGYRDHGLQLLATAMTLSEWTYAFGLDPTTSGQSYGGISFDPRRGIAAPLGPYDPRKNKDGAGLISGTYTINFPSSASLELAINIKEEWTRNREPISLEEQSRVWTSVGMAYQKMRPGARTAIANAIFSPNKGMFPQDAHLLPLAFLPGMAKLLDGPIIEPNTYEIHEFAALAGNSVENSQTASLKTLVRLARALLTWNIAAANLPQDRLSPEVMTEVEKGRPQLKDSMRLSIQTILDKHVDTQLSNSRLGSIGLVESMQRSTRPSMEIAAEALSVMVMAEQSLFHSDTVQTDYQKKLIGLFHWFAAEYLSGIARGQNLGALNPEAVLWSHQALKLFAKYPPQITQAPWLQDAIRNLEAAIQKWDGNQP